MINKNSSSLLRLIRNALILSSLTLLPLWVLLYFFWPTCADLIFYANVLDMFSNQLWNGDLYPRWLEAADNHKGAPVLVFYAPLVFYVGSVWQFLSVVDPHGIARVLMTAQLLLIVSAVTCYYWLRNKFDEGKAVVASLAYAFFPYGIWLLYFSFQLAPLACMMWLPMAFLAVDLELKKHHVHAASLFIIAICLLFLSHFLYTLILIPVIICYALFHAQSNVASTARLFLSGVIGGAMAAIYWLTAIINTPHFDMQHLWTTANTVDNLSKYKVLIFAFVLIALPMVMTLFISRNTPKRFSNTCEAALWFGVLFFSCFMATRLSQPLWEHISVLRYFQYPFRFLILAIPAAVYLSAQLLSCRQLQDVYHGFLTLAVVLGVRDTRTEFILSPRAVLPLLSEHRIVRVGNSIVGAEYVTDLAYGHFDGGSLPGLVSLAALVCAGIWVLFLKIKYKRQHG